MCFFKDVANCKEAVCPYVKDIGKCALYYKFYLRRMAGEVIPFNYDPKVQTLNPGLYFSRDINKAKSCMVKTALGNHSSVKRLTLSQVLNAALDDECELPMSEYYFIESTGKNVGDPSKIMACVRSQLEKMLLWSKVIVVCAPRDPSVHFDFTVIK